MVTQSSKRMMERFIEEPLLSFEVTPLAMPVWNPLEFIPAFDEDEPHSLTQEYFGALADGAEMVAEKLGIQLTYPTEETMPLRGMEVGDDRIDVATTTWPLVIALYAQSEVYGFETSWKDTAIRSDCYNFCEVTSVVPTTRVGGITYAKRRNFDKLEFVDVPPLRIILDVQKGDRGHSSSRVGKSSMHGVRTVSARTSCKPVMNITGWVQDTTLCTALAPDPKYLPRILGGSGAPSLWGNPVNTYLYLKSFKHGSYERIYGSAINELRSCVRDLDMGKRTQPVLCSFLRANTEYLHITYGANVLVPQESIAGTAMLPAPEPLYRALGGTALLQGVENRLIQAGKILTETGANAEMKVTTSILRTLFGDEPVTLVRENEKLKSRRDRTQFDGALRANAAVQRLLAREANEHDLLELAGGNFLLASSATTQIDRYQCEWIHLGGRGEAFSIQDLIFSEDMYLREEVSMERTLKVGGIPLRPELRRGTVEVRSEARIGLWQVSASQEEWADRICTLLLRAREGKGNLSFQDVFPIYYENREWVNDDSLLISRASSIASTKTAGAISLVSADIRLGRVMARTSGLPVVCVNPVDVIRNSRRTVLNSLSTFKLEEVFGFQAVNNVYHQEIPPIFDEILVDTGSLAAVAQRVTNGEVQGKATGSFFLTEMLRTGINDSGKRYEVNRLTLVNGHHPFVVTVNYRNGETRRFTLDEQSGASPRNAPIQNRSRAFLSRFALR